jgi:hypothetical protein
VEERMLELVSSGDFAQVRSCLSSEDVMEFESLFAESLELWNEFYAKFRDSQVLYYPNFLLKNDLKPYAVDAMVVMHALGVESEKVRIYAKLFLAEMLLLHLLDDFVDDPGKFKGKFVKELEDKELRASALSLVLNFQAVVVELLSQGSFSTDEALVVRQKFDERISEILVPMAKSSSYSTLEEGVMKVKGRMTGLIMCFLGDMLRAGGYLKEEDPSPLYRSLYHLGVLTQLTDEIRDMQDDANSGNPNVFLTSTGTQRETREAFSDWLLSYSESERKFRESAGKVGIKNQEICLLLPWYPFFLNETD